MFKIIVVGGPAEEYVGRCLQSLVAQTVDDWEACVVLDPVGDKTYENACAVKDPRIKVTLNDERQFALQNTCDAIDTLDMEPDDIIVSVDADDWLTFPPSLERVKAEYEAHPWVLMTYGSWVGFPNPSARTNTTGPYTEEDFGGNIRKLHWRASHLKTFRRRLWDRVDRKDFVDPRGHYFRVSWDLAFMWPMLEMAGPSRSRYIPDRIYTHNQKTPYNDSKVRLKEQMFFTQYIASMPQYDYVEDI